jgi:hypothetical protein
MGLNAKTAREALKMFGRGKSQAAIARKLGVARMTINDLVYGRTWKHLHVPTQRPRSRDSAEALFTHLTEGPADWIARGIEAVRAVASVVEDFTTDDVWAEIERPAGADPRAMGDVMRLAHKEGICEPTDRVRPSRFESHGGRPLRVWRSLAL